MKDYLRQFLLITIVLVFLYLLFHFSQSSTPQKPAPQSLTVPGLPVNLVIPAINVDAAVQYVGVDVRGDMEVPSNTINVGWFKLGTRPGEKGSAVISGHIDGNDGEAGVFDNLHKLQKGDKVYIEDHKGAMITFVVQESRIYNPGYAEEVFSTHDTMHLNLITCDGVWDHDKKSYSKRLVVFATIEN